MPPGSTLTRKSLFAAATVTVLLYGVLGLGVYAVFQGFVQREFVFFAEAFGALLFAGVGVPPMTRFWLHYFKGKP